MLQALPLATTAAEVVTLVIPLGLLLLTVAWALWVLFGHRSGPDTTVSRPTEAPSSHSSGSPSGSASSG